MLLLGILFPHNLHALFVSFSNVGFDMWSVKKNTRGTSEVPEQLLALVWVKTGEL